MSATFVLGPQNDRRAITIADVVLSSLGLAWHQSAALGFRIRLARWDDFWGPATQAAGFVRRDKASDERERERESERASKHKSPLKSLDFFRLGPQLQKLELQLIRCLERVCCVTQTQRSSRLALG